MGERNERANQYRGRANGCRLAAELIHPTERTTWLWRFSGRRALGKSSRPTHAMGCRTELAVTSSIPVE
jgi:hypothetical protein